MANDRSTAALFDPSGCRDLLPPAGRSGSQSAWQLMAAAVRAFAERGYHGASVRDLCAIVGIKPGSFYSVVESKEHLLFQVLQVAYETHQDALRNAVLAAGSNPEDQLRDFARAAVTYHCQFPFLTMVANTEVHALDDRHRDHIFALRKDSTALGVSVLERGNEQGLFDCPDPWLAMSSIGGMMIRVAWWFRPRGADGSSPLTIYPSAVSRWLPAGGYSVEEVADAYASYALSIARGEHGRAGR